LEIVQVLKGYRSLIVRLSFAHPILIVYTLLGEGVRIEKS